MKNEQTMELIAKLNCDVLSNTFVTAWIMRQIMECGNMYEKSARCDEEFVERVKKSFERAMNVAGCRSDIPGDFDSMADTVTCVTSCIAVSVGTIKKRASTRFTLLFSAFCDDGKKNPWDDVLEYAEGLKRHIFAAMDFTDSGSVDDLPLRVFAEVDELREIAYLCKVLCSM